MPEVHVGVITTEAGARAQKGPLESVMYSIAGLDGDVIGLVADEAVVGAGPQVCRVWSDHGDGRGIGAHDARSCTAVPRVERDPERVWREVGRPNLDALRMELDKAALN